MRLKVISSGGNGPSHMSESYVIAGAHPMAVTLCGVDLKITKNAKVEQAGPVSCVPCISEWRKEHPPHDAA